MSIIHISTLSPRSSTQNNFFSLSKSRWVLCISITMAAKSLSRKFPMPAPSLDLVMKSSCFAKSRSSNGMLSEGTENQSQSAFASEEIQKWEAVCSLVPSSSNLAKKASRLSWITVGAASLRRDVDVPCWMLIVIKGLR